MSRLLIAATAFAMTATTAVAAPGFGSMSAASQNVQRAESESIGLLAMLASFFSIEFSLAEAGAPVAERQRSVGATADECEQAKTAREQEKPGPEKAAGHQGPDPMLLAF